MPECRFIAAQLRPVNIRNRICATTLETLENDANPSQLIEYINNEKEK